MASGIEYRQARQASQQFENTAYKFVGGAVLGVMALVGVGVFAFNSRLEEPSNVKAAIAAPKPAKRAAAASKMTPYEQCMAKAKASSSGGGLGVLGGVLSATGQNPLDAIERVQSEMECERQEEERKESD
jgi:hypothetical protein